MEQSHDKVRDIKGTRVNVVNNSSAADMGLEDGDIITHINGFLILDWQDMGAAIDMMTVGDNMTVAYIRNEKKGTANGVVKSLAETKHNSYSYSYSYSDDDDDDDDNDNWNFNFNDNDGGDRNGGSRFDIEKRNVEDLAVEIEDMTKSESDRLKERSKVDIPSTNNLSVSGLNLAPNPKKGMFDLTFQLPNRGNTAVNLYNAEGRNIYNYDLGTFSGTFEDLIDISQNGVGTYFLQISQDSRSLVKKVLLSKK